MGICKIGRLVAFMLLMVVLSTVNGQPVQMSSSYAYCPAEYLELQMANIADRLSGMEATISSTIKGQTDQPPSPERCSCPENQLEVQLVNITTQLSRLEGAISSMNNSITGQSDQPPSPERCSCPENELEVRLVNIATQLSRMEPSISSTTGSVNQLEDRLANTATQLSRMEASVTSITGSVNQFNVRLVNIATQLSRMETTISSMNSNSIKANCVVNLASYGYDDSSKYGYIRTSGGSSVEILDPNNISRNAGFTLVELDPKTCTTRNRQRYVTHDWDIDREQLLDTMQSATAGTIILGVSADSAESSYLGLRKAVNGYFTRYSMNLQQCGFQFRDKFAFVMQAGHSKKTVFERKARYGDSLKLNVAIRGSSIYDVTFSRV